MSMFQNVQAAAALGQQNLAQQSAMQTWIDGRNDEMYQRYADSQRRVNQTAREIFNPTLEKMFSQMMEGSSVGQFLATAAGESRVKVAEAMKMAEMDAQDNIQARMLEGAKSAPFMTIGGQTGPTNQGDTPATDQISDGEETSVDSSDAKKGDSVPPATAKSPSNVRIPSGATPGQAAAIQGVASRSAPQRFGYSFPQLKLSQNPYGGLIAENAQTGERFVFSEEALGAMRGAITAENEALRADATMTFANSISKQSRSNSRFQEASEYILGDDLLRESVKNGILTKEQADMFALMGIRPSPKDMKDFALGKKQLREIEYDLKDDARSSREEALNDRIKQVSEEIEFYQTQVTQGNAEPTNEIERNYLKAQSPHASLDRSNMQAKLNEARNLRQLLVVQKEAMYDHRVHGRFGDAVAYALRPGANTAPIDAILKIAATNIVGVSDPRLASFLLPQVIGDSEDFTRTLWPEISRTARELGWNISDDIAGVDVWRSSYIRNIEDSVRVDEARKTLREDSPEYGGFLQGQNRATSVGRGYLDDFANVPEVPSQQEPRVPSQQEIEDLVTQWEEANKRPMNANDADSFNQFLTEKNYKNPFGG